ncbi:protein CIP2A homolog isoform X2 [Pocillopora damicornis]|uniref:protein CIP2A homolog isoform X2 n=1 Tax=Pocillopora damicornis TaxID=46731 RepID=UPI000F5528DC|nr:protein CIP2A homolog isoform X2 [Pocillopora damicornis]
MSLDVTACLKALSSAFCQYRSHNTDHNTKDLERQIDVLIGITSAGKPLRGFNAKELLPAECLSSLVGLLSESSVKPSLHTKSMALLFNLANDRSTRETLHSTYHLTSTLAALLHKHHLASNGKMILQCLKLLERVTYGCKFTTPSGYIGELIRYLVNNIQMQESDLTIPCLGLLANLCRHNLPIQAHVKALENIKSLYRTLIAFLSHSNLTVIVFALSILTSLSLHEQLGEKLFNSKNIHQTFQLVFTFLINGEGSTTRRSSVDLFVDLLASPKIQQSLLIHEHLAFYLEQILALLHLNQADEAVKVFELLLTFCSVTGLRCLVCRALFSPASSKPKDPNVNSAYDAVLYWASQSVDTHSTVSLKALDFIKEIYEELVDGGLLDQLSPPTSDLVSVLTQLLVPPTEIDGSLLKQTCAQINKAMEVLNVLCFEDSLKSIVLGHIKLECWWKLLEYQYQHNSIGTKSTLALPWSQEGVNLVLQMLDLLCKLKNDITGLKLASALQDQRLVPFLARAMSSDSRDSVQKALRILCDANSLPDFQAIWLGDLIASNNAAREEEMTLLRRPNETDLSPPSSPRHQVSINNSRNSTSLRSAGLDHAPVQISAPVKNANRDANIESLIEKMKSGLEIKPDPHASEIMDIYEAKMAAFVTKESHLQDLLEAKALALAQADRLISQYRCRRAQSEAECAKLMQLLQTTEKKAEQQAEQINELLQAQKSATKEMEVMMRHNENLKVVAEEHEQLKIAFAEQSQRLETSQRSLMAAQDEHKALSDLNEMLRRHNDNLKSQHDCTSRQLQELEQERKKIAQQLKEKDLKCQELRKTLQKQEEETKQREKNIEDLQEKNDSLKSNLAKAEKERKELSHKLSSLELICRQHEDVIKKREATVKELQSELDRQAQIAAMIHNLSSGKVPLNNFGTNSS